MGIEHEKLAEDLAYNLGGTPYLDVPLGSVLLSEGVQRADVIKIKPSYTRFCVSIYEVKYSRSDFLSDIRKDKWRGYLKHCHRFYFAVEKGVAKKEDIPDPAGLIIRGDNGWKVIKPAKVQNIKIPQETLLSLLFMKERLSVKEKESERNKKNIEKYSAYSDYKNLKQSFGKQIADILKYKNDYMKAKQELENKKYTLDDYIEVIKKMFSKTTGLDYSWEINVAIRQLRTFFNKLNILLQSIEILSNNGMKIDKEQLDICKDCLENIQLSKKLLNLKEISETDEIKYQELVKTIENKLKEINKFFIENRI